MPCKTSRLGLLALLLGIAFLAAQFHFCADLTTDPSSSHVCPLCTAAGVAVLTYAPNVAIASIAERLGSVPGAANASIGVPRETSPRAPPSC